MAQPKLLEQYRERLRVKHYSLRTEEAYLHWARRFNNRDAHDCSPRRASAEQGGRWGRSSGPILLCGTNATAAAGWRNGR